MKTCKIIILLTIAFGCSFPLKPVSEVKKANPPDIKIIQKSHLSQRYLEMKRVTKTPLEKVFWRSR